MLKSVVKGLITFIPGAYNTVNHSGKGGGTHSPRYCYGVWLRHLRMAQLAGLNIDPRMVAELGPGASIGIGLAALLTGAERYYAFDVTTYANTERNVEVFDGLVELFLKRSAVPDQNEFPQVRPYLDSYEFPSELLPSERLNAALDPARVAALRTAIANEDRNVVRYQVPWYGKSVIEPNSVDMVYSQAVLEHVDAIAEIYGALEIWLKPGGFMSHTIDFRCHQTATAWNGHWAYSPTTWALIRGRRPYLINRLPHSHHLDLIRRSGFEIVCDVPVHQPSKLSLSNVDGQFQTMTESDLMTSGAFIQAVKTF